MGLTWEEVEASAQDRHSWRSASEMTYIVSSGALNSTHSRRRVALCIGDAG